MRKLLALQLKTVLGAGLDRDFRKAQTSTAPRLLVGWNRIKKQSIVRPVEMAGGVRVVDGGYV